LQMYFWGWVCQRLCTGLFPVMLACLDSSSQTVGSLLRALWLIY
jgi:hypothetical protein